MFSPMRRLGSSWRFPTSALDPIVRYFAERRQLSRIEGKRAPSAPSRESLKAMVECAFWASLKAEEGRYPRFSMVYAHKRDCPSGLEFGSPRMLRKEEVAKLAPSLSRNNSRLGVVQRAGGKGPIVWGVTQEYPFGCAEIRVVRPGRVMVEAYGERLGLVNGDKVHSLLRRRHWDGKLQGHLLWELAKTLGQSVGEQHSAVRSKVLGTMLLQLTEAMHAHEHGGAIIVAPENDVAWKGSVAFGHPLRQFAGLRTHFERLIEEVKTTDRTDPPQDIASYFTRQRSRMNQDLTRLVETVGAFTAVDGATVLNDSLEVLGFGAKIRVKPKSEWRKPVECSLSDLVAGHRWDPRKHECEFGELGGTRHQSAAFLVSKHRGVVVIVASQDGALSIVAWSTDLKRVTVTRKAEMLLE